MASMGIPNSPSGLELTIAPPGSGNGVHISSSSCDGTNGSNIETGRELALLETFNNGEEVDVQQQIMETEHEKDRPPVGESAIQPHRKYHRLSQEQTGLLQESFQESHFPNKETKLALAETLQLTLKQVEVWFMHRRARFRKQQAKEQNEEPDSNSVQVESSTSETHILQRKVKKLKKKLKKLKLKMASSSSTAPPPPTPPVAAAAQEQPQQKVMYYIPVHAGVFSEGEQSVATTSATTAPFITRQGSVSATAALPLLLPPPSGGSNI